jgi:MFS family permease
MTDSLPIRAADSLLGPTQPQASLALRVSIGEGALHAVMVGATESYLGAFAVELGHGPEELALLATVPLLVGAGAQLASPLLCGLLGGRKRLAVLGATVQALSIAGLVAIAWHQNTSLAALLTIQLIFWVSASAMAPAWSSWMADLTTHTERSRYFARRSGLIHVVLLCAFTGAGLFLHHAGTPGPQRFVVLFGIGLLARLGSALALSLQADVEEAELEGNSDPLERIREAWCQARFRVALYLAALAFGTQVAAPFFTPYMLRELALDYQSFAVLSAVSILAKALVFPCCHHLAARFGLRNLLWSAGVGVAVVPLVWAASPHFAMLVLANVLGGVAWAGLEYSSFQLLLESAPGRVKTEFFSLSSTLTGLGQVTGALGGGLLLERHALAYPQVFVLSALLRGLSLSVLFLFVRAGDFPGHLRALYTRVVSVRPGAGADQRPIVDEPDRS